MRGTRLFIPFYFYVPGPVDHITDALDSLTTRDEADKQDELPPGEEEEETIKEGDVDESESLPRTVTTDWRPIVGRSTPPLERTADPLTGVTIQQIRRRHEICQRHVPQLFIRGEQVAMVAVLPA